MKMRVLRICAILMISCLVWNCRAQQMNCSSACGTIQNIKYPFRLEGDPESCGHPAYQLSCIQNRTILHLNNSKSYLVLSINYDNYTIRIVDPGLENHYNNHSPSPRYALNEGDVPKQYIGLKYDDISNDPVIFIGCINPAKSSWYANKDYAVGYFNHSYVLFGGDVGDIEDSCSMTGVTWSSSSSSSWQFNSSSSLDEIREALSWGFELFWCSADCLDNPDRFCDFNNSGAPTCINIIPNHFCNLIRWHRHSQHKHECIRHIFGILDDYWTEYRTAIGKLIGYIVAGRFFLGLLFQISIFVYKLRRRHFSAYDTIEDYLSGPNNLMPIRYSYSEIKKMTNNFKHKLGEGGYGIVFKGTLRSGPFVAVKMMGKSKGTGQDFISEVGTIGRIHHTNVVRMIGFCVEGSKRALLYEFMPNGSLEKYISPKEGCPSLSYEKMFEICVGVARGIDYLHRGCDMRILHFDIKPHNILLDENFSPKVSDFGLAKLYPTEDSIVSLTAARGTMGYMAPELFYRSIGGISHKADVYSFGMLLIEMGGRRKNVYPIVENTSQIYFPSWVYEQFKDGKNIDMGDATEEEKKLAKKMIIVAFWCIQMKPCDRPCMNEVVEMLERDVEQIEMPPRPFLCADDVPTDDDMSIDGTQSAESPLLSCHPSRSFSLELSV